LTCFTEPRNWLCSAQGPATHATSPNIRSIATRPATANRFRSAAHPLASTSSNPTRQPPVPTAPATLLIPSHLTPNWVCSFKDSAAVCPVTVTDAQNRATQYAACAAPHRALAFLRMCTPPRSLRLLVVLWLFAGASQGAEPLRVLFIGNSYTYVNNAPQIFAQLARAALPGRQVEAGMAAVGGATLVSLWEHSDALRVLRSSKWDYVVLQENSLLGGGLRDGKFVVNAPSLFDWGVRLFDTEIRRAGARTVLLLTWSRRGEPDQQQDLDYAYDSVARELGAVLAPVGPAWKRAREQDPGLELYAKDGSHPSPLGSYLLACVVLSSLFPKANGGLPFEISGPALGAPGTVSGGNTVLVSMPAEQARKLQGVARSVVSELKRTGGYLGARAPRRPEEVAPAGAPIHADDLAGAWTGELDYYPDPALLDLTLRFEGVGCQGEVSIKWPNGKLRFDAPLAECAISGSELRFSVATLPLPSLIDRFSGRIVKDRLAGTVERTGRDLTNSMTGVWNLHRH